LSVLEGDERASRHASFHGLIYWFRTMTSYLASDQSCNRQLFDFFVLIFFFGAMMRDRLLDKAGLGLLALWYDG